MSDTVQINSYKREPLMPKDETTIEFKPKNCKHVQACNCYCDGNVQECVAAFLFLSNNGASSITRYKLSPSEATP